MKRLAAVVVLALFASVVPAAALAPGVETHTTLNGTKQATWTGVPTCDACVAKVARLTVRLDGQAQVLVIDGDGSRHSVTLPAADLQTMLDYLDGTP